MAAAKAQQADAKAKDTEESGILDADGDGWDDLWCAMYPDITHRDRTKDSDGDGRTDYDAMLHWQSPFAPKVLTDSEKKAAAVEAIRLAAVAGRMREMEWTRQQIALAPFAVLPFMDARGEYATGETIAGEKKAALAALAQQEAGKAAAARVRVDDFTRQQGFDKYFMTPQGGVAALVDVVGGQPQSYVTHNVNAADTISTDEVRTGGNLLLTLTGYNFVVGLWDGGDVLLSHQEFTNGNNHIVDRDGASPLGVQGHPTHVTGTMAARGGVAAALGMSPSASVDARDYFDDLSEMTTAAGAVAFHLSNHSYGFQRGWGTITGGVTTLAWYGDTTVSQTEDYAFGYYDPTARTVDQITYAAPGYLPVWSAGNERAASGNAPPTQPAFHYAFNGTAYVYNNQVRPADHANHTGFDLLSSHGVAKNVLTITAVNDLVGGYVNAAGVTVANFSSFGPVDDGRVKPDLAANGVQVTSTWSTATNAYNILDGTSMAAPSVTGSLNLLVEHYANLFGSADGLRAASLKALAIHTADEAGANPGPDYTFGWGLMNTRTAAQLLTSLQQSGNARTHLKQVTLNNSDYVEFPIIADNDAATPLRVTLCWTDPAGVVPPHALNANVAALVNDLDLRITSGASTYFPWSLNPASPAVAATNTGDNNRDNVEMVNLASPVNGQSYLVRVTHKGTLVNAAGQTAPQALTILVSGVQAELETFVSRDANLGDRCKPALTPLDIGGGDDLSHRIFTGLDHLVAPRRRHQCHEDADDHACGDYCG